MILTLIAIALLAGLVVVYNMLVGKRQMVRNGWADIDVQLKRRANLIPSLMETVKGYAAHERQLFQEVTEKRSQAQQAGDDARARGAAESALSQPIGRLMAVAEAYPDLKASENFRQLQDELSDTENKIEMARRFYNGAVRELNTLVESFPASLVAGVFGFRQATFFEVETSDRAVPEVGFGDGR
ncbi:LemA family protein [Henriciella aquimarina]|uniref:LemA family protein n=1 Tax=Henriciella aquimarina TaxID=545261 RepID=UPI000A025B35